MNTDNLSVMNRYLPVIAGNYLHFECACAVLVMTGETNEENLHL